MWQRFDIHRYPGVHGWYERVQSRPSWVWQTAAITAVVVFAIPVILLVLAAVLAAAVVFTVLSLVFSGIALLRRLLGIGTDRGWAMPRDDGRRNVRVRMTSSHDRPRG